MFIQIKYKLRTFVSGYVQTVHYSVQLQSTVSTHIHSYLKISKTA